MSDTSEPHERQLPVPAERQQVVTRSAFSLDLQRWRDARLAAALRQRRLVLEEQAECVTAREALDRGLGRLDDLLNTLAEDQRERDEQRAIAEDARQAAAVRRAQELEQLKSAGCPRPQAARDRSRQKGQAN